MCVVMRMLCCMIVGSHVKKLSKTNKTTHTAYTQNHKTMGKLVVGGAGVGGGGGVKGDSVCCV